MYIQEPRGLNGIRVYSREMTKFIFVVLRGLPTFAYVVHIYRLRGNCCLKPQYVVALLAGCTKYGMPKGGQDVF